MRRWTLITIMLAAAFAASSAEKTITDPALGIALNVPEDWPPNITPGAIDFLTTGAGNPYVRIEVRNLPKPELRSFFEELSYRAILKESTLLNAALARIAGVIGFRLDFEYVDRRVVTHYFVSGNRGYAIWMSAQQSGFDNYAATFDALIASFKLLQAK